MRHRFLPELPLYIQCVGCGYIDEAPLEQSFQCRGCGKSFSTSYLWFPDAAYEFAIILADYDARLVSHFRQQYFDAQAVENSMEYFASMTEPEIKPTNDWKPITIILFRSLFELLLEHFLWKVAWIYWLPASDAEVSADAILEKHWTVSSRLNKVYLSVTGHKWKDDVIRLRHQDLAKLLDRTAKVRNEFVHGNPLAGHKDPNLSTKARQALPELFTLFVELANLHFHPRAVQLRDMK